MSSVIVSWKKLLLGLPLNHVCALYWSHYGKCLSCQCVSVNVFVTSTTKIDFHGVFGERRDFLYVFFRNAEGAVFDASQYAFFGKDVVEEVELGGLEDEELSLPAVGTDEEEFLYNREEVMSLLFFLHTFPLIRGPFLSRYLVYGF